MRLPNYRRKFDDILSDLDSKLSMILNGNSEIRDTLPETIDLTIRRLIEIRDDAIRLEQNQMKGKDLARRWKLSEGRISQIKNNRFFR